MIEQGDFINRPSRIGLEVKGKPGGVEEVRVGGTSVMTAVLAAALPNGQGRRGPPRRPAATRYFAVMMIR